MSYTSHTIPDERLFATILVFCKPSDVFGMWQKRLDEMLEDYQRNCPSPMAVEQIVLIDLRNMLQSMGKDIKSFPLPDIDDNYDTASGIPHEIFEEPSIVPSADDVVLSESVNGEQRAAYDDIMSPIETD